MNPLLLRRGFPVVLLALAFFALPQLAPAVTPAPDGSYFGGITAEGDDALFSLTTGQSNTAIGFEALYSNTTGAGNTATGTNVLFSNTTGNLNTASGYGALYFCRFPR